MESTAEEYGAEKKYKGIRRRKWGKWVSEIRVPGSQNRLWLGSYSTPEGAAVAHDVAFYCLRRPPSLVGINFPLLLPVSVNEEMSPKSVQKAASDAGMAVDAQMILNKSTTSTSTNETEDKGNGEIQVFDTTQLWEDDEYFGKSGEKELNISVDDYKVDL